MRIATAVLTEKPYTSLNTNNTCTLELTRIGSLVICQINALLGFGNQAGAYAMNDFKIPVGFRLNRSTAQASYSAISNINVYGYGTFAFLANGNLQTVTDTGAYTQRDAILMWHTTDDFPD